MHQVLNDVMHSTLPITGKMLFSLVYARTNGTGRAEILTADLCAALSIGEANLRRYRGVLATNSICDSTAKNGLITFVINPQLWDGSAHPMRETRTPCAERAPDAHIETVDAADAQRAPDAHNAHPMRETRTPCALSSPANPPHTPPMLDSKIVNNINTSPLASNAGAGAREARHPLPANPDLTAAEIAANMALLAEMGVSMPQLAEIAAALDPMLLYRHVADWSRKYNNGTVYSPGALVAQCTRPDWNPPPLTDAIRESREYRAFMRAARPPADEADDAPQPLPVASGARTGDWEPWPAVLQHISRQMTRGTFDLHLRDSIADADGETITVITPDASSAEWLDKRLRPIIERSVAAVIHRDANIIFTGATP